jgi:hypothetical protein
MNFNASIELEKIIFDLQRETQLNFIKESITSGEYLINPRVIATRLLNSCFEPQKENCISD